MITATERKAVYHQALASVAWQRELLYQLPLYPPQVEAIQLVERHIANATGKVLTIRSSRQTMKNECSAMLQVRAFLWHQADGGIYIRTAPTWKPQIVVSKHRLERFLKRDPLIDHWRPREGYIYEVGNVQVVFLSTEKSTEVVGATASICLDVDEAHKVDKGKFEEDFAPMTAWTGVPTILWGVGADKQDLLYEYRMYNEERDPRLNLQYPVDVWCALRPEYARRYQEHVDKLGEDHPVILTQYKLIDVDVIGGFLKPHHIASLFSSTHDRWDAPEARKGCYTVAVIDIAGEDEQEETDPLRKSLGARDSTTALFWEIDPGELVHDYPVCRLRQIYWWTGKALGDKPSGLPGQQTILLRLLNAWKPRSTVVDARGVGEQIAKYLADHWPRTVAYTATSDTVSEDCFSLLAMINNDRIKVFRNDQSGEYKEILKQAKTVVGEMMTHERMRIVKPPGGGHIDMVKAMTYLPRALGQTQRLNVFF